MNFYKIILSVFFIMSEDIQNISSTHTSEVKFHSHIHKNMKSLHNVLNKLFTSLKLNKKFNVKNRLLLTMHKDLLKKVRNNHKKMAFENITDNKPINDFAYYMVLDIIIQDESLLFPYNTTNLKDTICSIIDKNLLPDVSGNLKQLLSTTKFKPNGSNLNDTVEESFDKNSTRRRINLKPWVPIPNSKEDATLDHRRIFKSKSTTIKTYPFMASIHVDQKFVGAGCIIGKGLIITAASCLQVPYVLRQYKDPSNVTVRIGGETTQDGELLSIQRIHFHPTYNPETLYHNLAILRTEEKILAKVMVRRVLYDRSSEEFPEDVKRIKMLGWGASDVQNKPTIFQELSRANLALYDRKDCEKAYSKYYVSNFNFCAGSITEGSGACSKDVGDPAIVTGTLVGIVSFGPPSCGTPDAPTVFTRLGIYAPWIDSVVQLESVQNERKILRNLKYGKNSNSPVATVHPKSFDIKDHVFKPFKYNYDYPEEVLIMKEILKDMTGSNQSLINQILNEESINKEFRELMDIIETTTKMDVIHSPLINKSYFPLDNFFPIGKSFPSKQQETNWAYGPKLNLLRNLGPQAHGNWNNNVPLTETPVTTTEHSHKINQALRQDQELKRKRRPLKAQNPSYYSFDSDSETDEGLRLQQSQTKPTKTTESGYDTFDSEPEVTRRPEKASTSKTTRKRSPFVEKINYNEDYEYPYKTTRRRLGGVSKPATANDYEYMYPTKSTKKPQFVGKPINHEYDYYYPDKTTSKRPSGFSKTANSNTNNDKYTTRFTKRPPFIGKPIYDYDYDRPDKTSSKRPAGVPPSYGDTYNDKQTTRSTKRPPFVGKPIHNKDYDYEYLEKSISILPGFPKSTSRPPFIEKPIHNKEYDYEYQTTSSNYNDKYSTRLTSRPPFVGKPIHSYSDRFVDKTHRERPKYSNSDDEDYSDETIKYGSTVATDLFEDQDHAFDNYEAEYYSKGLSIEVTKQLRGDEKVKPSDDKHIYFIVDIPDSEEYTEDKTKRSNKNKEEDRKQIKSDGDSISDISSTSETD